MSVLAAAVETGSFSAAGRQLGMPLPTVSRKVSELEALLKTRLLVRTTRKLVLTDAGAAYLAAARRILDLVEDAEAQASGEYSAPRGDLILTAPIAFGRLHVLPVAVEFLAEFPQVQVRMRLSDRNVNLVEDHVDMAVRIGALADSSMIATRVGFVRRVVCGSPGYFADHGIPEKPADLAHHICVGFSAPASNAAWIFSNPAERGMQSVTVPSRLSIDTAEAVIDAAIAGAGLTNVLSYQVAEAVAQKKLRIVLADFEPEPVPVHLVHAAQGMLPLKMRSFLDFAAPRLRRSLEAVHVRALALPS
jgi:DNA-binding transcriptional LysR family regulator